MTAVFDRSLPEGPKLLRSRRTSQHREAGAADGPPAGSQNAPGDGAPRHIRHAAVNRAIPHQSQQQPRRGGAKLERGGDVVGLREIDGVVAWRQLGGAKASLAIGFEVGGQLAHSLLVETQFRRYERIVGRILDHLPRQLVALRLRRGLRHWRQLWQQARRQRGQRSRERLGERHQGRRSPCHPRHRGDYRESGAQPRFEQPRPGVAGFVEQHLDPPRQVRTVFGRGRRHQRRAQPAAQFDNPREAGGIRLRTARGCNHQVVAGDLALQVDLAGDPSHDGMERK